MKMNKVVLLGLCGTMLVTSCGSSAGSGALSGAMAGGWFGSAIGGILGGHYGHDVGTVIGMTTGAMVGAAAGAAEDNARREQVKEHYRRNHANNDDTYVSPRKAYSGNQQYGQQYDESGFDSSNSADDRIYDFQSSDYTGSYSSASPVSSVPTQSQIETISQRNLSYSNSLEIMNARLVDDRNDGILRRGETAKIIFEIKNTSNQVLFDIFPTVVETTSNKHIYVSPSMHVESISPGQTLRYTAVIAADKSLRDGQATFTASVVQGGKTISKVANFNVITKRK